MWPRYPGKHSFTPEARVSLLDLPFFIRAIFSLTSLNIHFSFFACWFLFMSTVDYTLFSRKHKLIWLWLFNVLVCVLILEKKKKTLIWVGNASNFGAPSSLWFYSPRSKITKHTIKWYKEKDILVSARLWWDHFPEDMFFFTLICWQFRQTSTNRQGMWTFQTSLGGRRIVRRVSGLILELRLLSAWS